MTFLSASGMKVLFEAYAGGSSSKNEWGKPHPQFCIHECPVYKCNSTASNLIILISYNTHFNGVYHFLVSWYCVLLIVDKYYCLVVIHNAKCTNFQFIFTLIIFLVSDE